MSKRRVALMRPRRFDDFELCQRYLSNPVTRAVVFGGLEPFEQFAEVEKFIHTLRIVYGCMDDVVIYTGFNKDEVMDKIEILSMYPNIIIKFGRYIPNRSSRYDGVLGVTLASDNQCAERIS